jgi:hypothetical protein
MSLLQAFPSPRLGEGGEMTQTLYADMNKRKKKDSAVRAYLSSFNHFPTLVSFLYSSSKYKR